MRTWVVRATVALFILGLPAVAALGEEKTRLMTVTIVAVDAKAMTMTVKNEIQGGETEELKLVLEPGVKVRIHGMKGRLDQLKAGDVVTVRYTVKGEKYLAAEIQHM